MSVTPSDLTRCCEMVREYLEEARKSKPLGFIDHAKNVAAVAGAITSVLYVLGYIIVNLRLLSFGISSYELADPAYLPAGIAFGVVVIGPLTLLVRALRPDPAKPKRHLAQSLVFSVFATLLYLMLFFVLGAGLLSLTQGLGELARFADQGFPVAGLRLFGSTAGWTGLLAFVILSLAAIVTTKADRQALLPAGSVALVILLFVTLSSWSRNVYARGNPALGGGAAAHVALVLKAKVDGASMLADFGLPGSGNIAEPIQLLRENDKMVAILMPDGHVLKLDRSLVQAIRYLH